MELETGTVVDRYTVQSVLGEGGMAVVYLCRHNQLGTLHALKVLSMSSRAIRERLVQEGQVQASLRHPNIVAVTDIVMLNGAPGLIMEYIQGPSLDDLLEQQRLTLEQVEVLAEGILRGVAHAHAMGLVHRDLKPANVMLALDGGTLIPKVTDFGLAKLVEGTEGRAATRTGSTMGTPHYMSPEQVADSKNVDARTDVFALGAILYEMVCGRRAFGGENLLQIFSAVADARYTHPRELCPELPARMERAILGALEPDREKRIANVEALIAVWTGRVDHQGSAPTAPAGPFGEAFVQSLRAVSADRVSSRPPTGTPEATWHAGASQLVSVESLHRSPEPVAPPAPEPVAAPASRPIGAANAPAARPEPVSYAPDSPSLVSGTSLAIGGGAAFMMAALASAALVVVLLGVVFALLAVNSDRDEPPLLEDHLGTQVQPPPDPQPIGVAPEPGRSPAPDVAPAPSPVTAPSPGVGRSPVAPAPSVAPVPVAPVPSVAPVPVAAPAPGGDPDPVAPAPVTPDPVTPAADAPQPVAPTFSGASGLSDADPKVRIAAIDAIQSDPGASRALVDLARRDPSRDVQVKAWQAVTWRYRNQTGDQALQESLITEALTTGSFSRREASSAYAKHGTDLDLLIRGFDAAPMVMRVQMPTDIVELAQRTGDSARAKALLEERRAQATGIGNKPLHIALTNAINRL